MSEDPMGNHPAAPSYPDSREILTTYGPIIGRRLVDEGDKQVDAFQGIPYAKPPVGELRFKKPVPPEPWTEVKECKKFGFRSIQKDTSPEAKSLPPTSEDCLTLNVFSPAWDAPDDNGFAVVVFIHGGAFVSDSCVKYGDLNICKNVAMKDVVVVTLQYRLGYLGMWTTGDDVCPGNLNLWDMTLALQWIKDNISRFNGNPGNVTISGQSAGGGSVDLLSLSPHSRDLFHKVIPMAGNAACDWAISYNDVELCREAAEKFGVSCCHDSEKYLEELRKLPAETFALSMFSDDGGITKVQLGPRIDGEFIPKHPDELRKEAPAKPRIVGLCRSEGLMFMRGPEKTASVDKIAADFFSEKDYSQKFKELRKEYFDRVIESSDVEDKEKLQKKICEAYSDWFLGNGAQRCVLECLENGEAPVYLYRFDHFNPKMFGALGPLLAFMDATHCSDISYFFGTCIVGRFEFDEDDKRVIDIMSTLFTNFAKYGDPNGPDLPPVGERWLPATKENPQKNLQIDVECKMSETFYDGRPLWFVEKMREHRV